MPVTSAEFEAQYTAITRGAAWVDFSSRTQIEFTGGDRAKFLHNLCTNAVRDLSAGQGCESFVLNVKGHIVGHVFLFVGPNSILLETVAGQAEHLIEHFDRYLIREDVQILDRSQEWSELLLAGPAAEKVLNSFNTAIPQNRLQHAAASLGSASIWIRRVDIARRNSFLIAFPRENLRSVQSALDAAQVLRCDESVFEAIRIETGFPLYVRDFSDENLPQEIDRDRLAISFTKGCYLGQETVARIDALGHVNRLLRLVKFAANEAPPTGLDLLEPAANPSEIAETKAIRKIGQITSACWSPHWNAPLAMAIVRRGFHEVGSKLESAFGPAEVVAPALR